MGGRRHDSPHFRGRAVGHPLLAVAAAHRSVASPTEANEEPTSRGSVGPTMTGPERAARRMATAAVASGCAARASRMAPRMVSHSGEAMRLTVSCDPSFNSPDAVPMRRRSSRCSRTAERATVIKGGLRRGMEKLSVQTVANVHIAVCPALGAFKMRARPRVHQRDARHVQPFRAGTPGGGGW